MHFLEKKYIYEKVEIPTKMYSTSEYCQEQR